MAQTLDGATVLALPECIRTCGALREASTSRSSRQVRCPGAESRRLSPGVNHRRSLWTPNRRPDSDPFSDRPAMGHGDGPGSETGQQMQGGSAAVLREARAGDCSSSTVLSVVGVERPLHRSGLLEARPRNGTVPASGPSAGALSVYPASRTSGDGVLPDCLVPVAPSLTVALRPC
jgi:hypothetical protein